MKTKMRRYVVLLLLLTPTLAVASDKGVPFRDAIFISKHTAPTNGVSCTGNETSTDARIDCGTTPGGEIFVIEVGNVRMTLTAFVPMYNNGLIGIVSHAATKNPSLDRALPGDHVFIRAEGGGCRIKVGNYDSMYAIRVSEIVPAAPVSRTASQ